VGESGQPPAISKESRHHAEQFVKTCEAELEVTKDAGRASRLQFEIAQTYDTQLANPKQALERYQASLELTPEFLPSLRSARRLLLKARNFPLALEYLEREIGVTSGSRGKAALHLLQGSIYEINLRDGDRARRCYLKAHEHDNTDCEAIAALSRLESQAGAWAALSGTYERAANAADASDQHRAAVLVQRAQLCAGRLGDVELATELYQSALVLDPLAPGAITSLKRLLYAQARWHDLVELLERETDEPNDVEVRVAAYVSIGSIYSERLGDLDRAIENLDKAKELNPRNRLVLEDLARHYEAADDPEALSQTLRTLVELIESPNEQLGLMHRLGRLCESAKDPKGAMKWYGSALSLSPTYVPALRSLGSLYQADESWNELIAMHLAEAEATHDTARRAEAHVRVAEIYDSRLGDKGKAAEHHAIAIGLVPGLLNSFKALTRLYAVAGQHRELIELYERAVDRAGDRDVVLTYLFKIGALHEDALADPAAAAKAYRRILDTSPENLGAIHALQRVSDAGGNHRVLIEALDMEMELTADPDRVIGICQRAGEVLAENLDDQEAALIRFNKVLGLDPQYAPALAGLARLHSKLGRWQSLLDIYEQELGLTRERDGQVTLLHKMGELSEKELADEDRAVGYYQRCIKIDPRFIPALRALSRIFRKQEKWDALIAVLETELEGLEDADTRARVAYRLGEVHENQRQDLSRAAAAYELALEQVPQYRPAIDGLARANSELENWTALADQLISEAESTSDEGQAVEALLSAGEVRHVHLKQTAAAIDAYDDVLMIQPGNLTALLSLVPLCREVESWPRLVEVLRELSDVLSPSRAKVAVLGQIARLIETRIDGEPGEVLEAYKKMLALEPHNVTALTALEDAAIAGSDHELLAEVNNHLAGISDDRKLSAVFKARMGLALEEIHPKGAALAFQEAFESDAESATAIRGLSRLAERYDLAEAKIAALRREAEWTRRGRSAAELLYRSATVNLEQAGDQPEAVVDLVAGLTRCPEHTESADKLLAVLRGAGDVDRLIEVLSAAANATADDDVKEWHLTKVAQLYADEKENLEAGISALHRLLKVKPGHVPTRLKLAGLYRRNRQWKETAEILRQVSQQKLDPEQQAEVLLELSDLSLEQFNDVSAAIGQLNQLLRTDPNNTAALDRLCRLLLKKGDVKAAHDAASKVLQATSTPVERASALMQLARVEMQGGGRAQAAEALREAVSLVGLQGSAAAAYKQLLEDGGPWIDYARALTSYIDLVAAGQAVDDNPLATMRELATVQLEQLGQPKEASATIIAAINRFGDGAELRFELGRCLAASGQIKEAVEQFEQLVRSDATRVDYWRALSHSLRLMKREREADFAVAPLVILGQATADEMRSSGQRLARPGIAEEGSFASDQLRRISPLAELGDAVTELLAALSDAVNKLFPLELSEYGLSARDRIGEGSTHPLLETVHDLCRAFGVDKHDLYVSNAGDSRVVVGSKKQAAVVVPAAVVGLPEPARVFVLARALAYAAQGHQLALMLDSREIAQVLTAVARSFDADFPRGDFDQLELEQLGKKLVKATGWMSRKTLEEAVLNFVSAGHTDLAQISTALEIGATRAAALLSCDLPASVAEIQRSHPELHSLQGAELVSSSPTIADLLCFWPSRPAYNLRRNAGLV
jgi:tetratricopeptide (TPR) repeat protein